LAIAMRIFFAYIGNGFSAENRVLNTLKNWRKKTGEESPFLPDAPFV
jgi:hypothetical protein